MIFTDKAAKEKIISLEQRVSELEADADSRSAEIESLKAEITAKDQVIAEHVAAIAARDEKIATTESDLAAANTALETATTELAEKDKSIEAAKESAGKLAAEALASIGQPEPLPVESETSTDPVALYLAAVESGDAKLRAEIFATHKEAIMAHRAKLNQ